MWICPTPFQYITDSADLSYPYLVYHCPVHHWQCGSALHLSGPSDTVELSYPYPVHHWQCGSVLPLSSTSSQCESVLPLSSTSPTVWIYSPTVWRRQRTCKFQQKLSRYSGSWFHTYVTSTKLVLMSDLLVWQQKLPVIQVLHPTQMLQAHSWFICRTCNCKCHNKNFRIAKVLHSMQLLQAVFFMLGLQTSEQKPPFTKVLHSTQTPQAQSCLLHSFLWWYKHRAGCYAGLRSVEKRTPHYQGSKLHTGAISTQPLPTIIWPDAGSGRRLFKQGYSTLVLILLHCFITSFHSDTTVLADWV